MKKNIFSILFALVLVLSFSLVTAVPVTATSLPVVNVDTAEEFSAIQAAIDDTDTFDGHTITVAAGTYNENIVIDKGLTLEGAQAGLDACGRSGSESIITASSGHVIYVKTADVTIDGFMISGNGANHLVFADNAHQLVFQNNILDGTAANGVWFGTTSSDVIIHQNELEGTSISGYLLFFDGGSDIFNNLTISNNCLHDGEVFAGAKSFGSHNMVMTGNIFDGANVNLSSAFEQSTIDTNMFQNNTYTNLQVGLRDSQICQNIFYSTGPSPYAGNPSYSMMLWGDQYGLTPSESVVITNNFFYFNGISAPGELANGLRILGGIDATNIEAFENSFVDGDAQIGARGLVNQGTGIANASGNWWGSSIATIVRAKANDGVGVDYTPWLANGTDTNSDPGYQGDFSELWVDDDSLQTGLTGRIQEGVNLVAASTVNVAAGTYSETVIINKGDLTLLGAKAGVPAGPDASPANRGTSESVIEGSVSGAGVSGSTIDGFTILSDQHGVILGGGDTVVNNILVGSGTSPWGGIWSGGSGGHFIAQNNIRDYFRGMLFDGGDVPPIVITENYITGSGSTGIIMMGSLCNGHAITNNLIEENSSGMVLAQGEHQVSGNRILNNDGSGIYIYATARTYGIQITQNTIQGNGWSIYLDGDHAGAVDNVAHFNNIVDNDNFLYNGHTAVFDARYNWWGDVSGPFHPTSWYYLSTTEITNPDGQGDEVDDYVLYEPWIGQAGMVTGGGWFDSPESAYSANPDLVGKATFGFIAKNKKEKTPEGNTHFFFKTADLNFHSSSYDWLVVTGSDYAKFKGSGTINGMGDYKFMIWAGDGDPDTFRIKIWEEDELDNETVVYDNGFDQELAGGSIVIHKK